MANNKLTLLACSGSILATTLFGMPSHGMPLSNFGDGSQRIERTTTSEPTQSEEIATPANYEKKLKQAAVNKFGCSCTNCVSSIRQLVRSGTLSV
jgi:hypothetical protein